MHLAQKQYQYTLTQVQLSTHSLTLEVLWSGQRWVDRGASAGKGWGGGAVVGGPHRQRRLMKSFSALSGIHEASQCFTLPCVHVSVSVLEREAAVQSHTLAGSVHFVRQWDFFFFLTHIWDRADAFIPAKHEHQVTFHFQLWNRICSQSFFLNVHKIWRLHLYSHAPDSI